MSAQQALAPVAHPVAGLVARLGTGALAEHDLALSAGALAVCVAGAIFSFRRHFTPGRGLQYRRINWMIPCLGFIAVGFVLVVHLVNLAGFETGRR